MSVMCNDEDTGQDDLKSQGKSALRRRHEARTEALHVIVKRPISIRADGDRASGERCWSLLSYVLSFLVIACVNISLLACRAPHPRPAHIYANHLLLISHRPTSSNLTR